MGFLGVYKAIYDYAPLSEGELQLSEGDLLYVIEKSEDDDWWKAKKAAAAEDEDEPVGLIPNNYVEEVPPMSQARALYEYTRQTDEELSFPEDAALEVFDTSDPDWILVGLDGDYGFVPANYIEMGEGLGNEEASPVESEAEPAPPSLPSRPPLPTVEDEDEDELSPQLPHRTQQGAEPDSSASSNPAAALAAAMGARAPPSMPPRAVSPPPALDIPSRSHHTEPSEDEISPPLPTRPRSSIQSAMSDDRASSASTSRRETSYRDPLPRESGHNDRMEHPREPARASTFDDRDYQPRAKELSPGGFHLYNINEMVSIMGKKKKMPTTLGVNLATGVILIAPEHTQDGPSQEWSADRMTHYSREGKHVFLELVRPSKSADFHAGAKDTAEEIVAALSELSGVVRAEGLREIMMAATTQVHKKGKMLYEFMAQGEDEVTVAEGDEVIILDDSKSEDWWQVRRIKNGTEGVVPSSYVEIIGTISTAPTSSTTGINAGKSSVSQNRLEEERLTKEAVRAARKDDDKRASERSKRENGRADGGSQSRSTKSKPDPSKVRTWTDRSKSFSVEAQFLGMKDGKLNLHKMNGVKIAVPIAKMSIEDLEYVERATGISLDEDKPLSEVKRANKARAANNASVGASVSTPKGPEYDWFQFFLSCEVNVGLCERYAQAFNRDSMDESVLPDVDAGVLRTLGLREGDIIKVMRFLDNKYGRNKKKAGEEVEGEGGLFSGPGGALRNNTRRGRPEPTRSASDVVDPKAFSNNDTSPGVTPATTTTAVSTGKPSGFDDDAWDVKPAKQQPPATVSSPAAPTPVAAAPVPVPAPAPAPALVPALTPGMQELSLLTQPLEPTKTGVSISPVVSQPPAQPPAPAPAQAPQPTGATPGFFSAMPSQQTGLPNGQLSHQLSLARQRPVAPQATQATGIIPPPPSRPFSAPQSAQASAFAPPPLQAQMTGISGQVAPPGQSLSEINQQRMQQQYAMQMQQQQQQMQPQMTGFPQQQAPGMYPMQTGMQPQQTSFGQNQFMQPMMTGQPMQQSPFADPRASQAFPMQAQPSGFPGQFSTGQFGSNPPPGGINSYLPPAMEPQRTGMPPPMQPQPTGMSFTQGFGNAPQQQQQPAALVPQQTGPPPPVRFGVDPGAQKLMAQPTGRRANLSAATPNNPFGF